MEPIDGPYSHPPFTRSQAGRHAMSVSGSPITGPTKGGLNVGLSTERVGHASKPGSEGMVRE